MTTECPTGPQAAPPGRPNLAGPASATVCAAIAFLLVLLVLAVNTFFVPKFKKIFEDFGTSLPAATQRFIAASDAVLSLGYLTVPLVLLAFAVLLVWIWKADWRSGLAAALLLALLMIAYGAAMFVALVLPLTALMSSAAGP